MRSFSLPIQSKTGVRPQFSRLAGCTAEQLAGLAAAGERFRSSHLKIDLDKGWSKLIPLEPELQGPPLLTYIPYLMLNSHLHLLGYYNLSLLHAKGCGIVLFVSAVAEER